MKKTPIVLLAIGLIVNSCCNEDFIMPNDYNYFEQALDITDRINNCSSLAEFSTANATSDGIAGSCWGTNNPSNNVWFKFEATYTSIWVDITVGDIYGTQQRTLAAIWSDKNTELDCDSYYYDLDGVYLYTDGLIVGQYYYISVDTYDSSGKGTFTLCIADD